MTDDYAIYYAGGVPCCDSTRVCATHHNAFLERDTCRTCRGYGALPLYSPDGEIDDSEPCPDCTEET